jgi:hypothetical protein
MKFRFMDSGLKWRPARNRIDEFQNRPHRFVRFGYLRLAEDVRLEPTLSLYPSRARLLKIQFQSSFCG